MTTRDTKDAFNNNIGDKHFRGQLWLQQLAYNKLKQKIGLFYTQKEEEYTTNHYNKIKQGMGGCRGIVWKCDLHDCVALVEEVELHFEVVR